MAQRNQDMGSVAAFGELVSEGCYHFRIAKVIDDGGNKVNFQLAVQTEPYVGRGLFENFDMDNPIALSKLKAYYKACGYEPVGGGHDPEQVSGGEVYAVVVHNIGKDSKTYANIAPWSITSLQQGPIQPLGPSAGK